MTGTVAALVVVAFAVVVVCAVACVGDAWRHTQDWRRKYYEGLNRVLKESRKRDLERAELAEVRADLHHARDALALAEDQRDRARDALTDAEAQRDAIMGAAATMAHLHPKAPADRPGPVRAYVTRGDLRDELDALKEQLRDAVTVSAGMTSLASALNEAWPDAQNQERPWVRVAPPAQRVVEGSRVVADVEVWEPIALARIRGGVGVGWPMQTLINYALTTETTEVAGLDVAPLGRALVGLGVDAEAAVTSVDGLAVLRITVREIDPPELGPWCANGCHAVIVGGEAVDA